MSHFVRLSQSPATRLATIHGDPIVVAMAVLIGFLGAWARFVSEGRDVEIRRVRRVEAMYQRRYTGRRMAGLRAELRTLFAGLVLTCRVFPKPIRIAALGTLMVVVMAGTTAAATLGSVPLLSTVRGRRPKGDARAGLAETLDAVDTTALLDRLQAYRPHWSTGLPVARTLAGPSGELPLGTTQHQRADSAASGRPGVTAALRVQHPATPHHVQPIHHAAEPPPGPGRRLHGRADRPNARLAASTWREGRGRFHDRAVPLDPLSQEQVDRSGERPRGELDGQEQPPAGRTRRSGRGATSSTSWQTPPTGYRSTGTPRPPARTTRPSCPAFWTRRPRPCPG